MTAVCVVYAFLFLVWTLWTRSVCRENATWEECSSTDSFSEMYSRYAPPGWKLLSRWFLIVWVVTFLLAIVLTRR